jgi:glycosyltransferase involved in cell wall biosynthesis
MKILYITQYFPPEVGATQSRAYEMAKNLINFGHQVTVMTEVPNHPSGIIPLKYKGKFRVVEKYDGIPVIRSWVDASPEKTFKTRMRFYLSFMITTIINSVFLRQGKFDAVYATSPPLFVGLAGFVIARLKNARFFFEVRDLWPESAIELGQIGNRTYITFGHGMADFCYRYSSAIIAVTRGIFERLEQKGVSKGKLYLIKNGTNPERFYSIHDLTLKEKLGWQSKFVVLYAGIHGVAQGLETVLSVAGQMKGYPKIHFAFVGDGPYKKRILELTKSKGISNVEFLPEVPADQIFRYISLADVCLVPLKKIKLFQGALPSKIFDIWACGKPIILGVDGEAREELEKAKGGIFVEPENVRAMAQAVAHFYQNPELCKQMGNNGRRFIFRNGYIRSLQARALEKVLTGKFLNSHRN